MPIYEYECTECQEIHEVSQSLSEAPLSTCPKCSEPVKKLISRSSFQLKGGGWYSDGYSGPSNKKEKSDKTSPAKPAPPNKSSSQPACPKATGASCPCQ
jgi:putative FmdB family regulatory protein